MSYAHEDRETVARIAKDLRQARAEVWLDVDALQLGDRWAEVIEDAIAGSDVMMTFISRASITSPFVDRELDAVLARQRDIGVERVIPVKLDNTPVSEIRPVLRARHWVDFSESYASGIGTLINGLGLRVGAAAVAAVAPTGPSLSRILGAEDLRSLVAGLVAEALERASMPQTGVNFTAPDGGIDESLAFVVIAFSPDMDFAFEAITLACAAVGLKAVRVKDLVGDYKITDKIETLIRSARIAALVGVAVWRSGHPGAPALPPLADGRRRRFRRHGSPVAASSGVEHRQGCSQRW